ncbi:hypothetical protein NAAC61_01080 [Petrotoga sp. 8T1HF07.NaAc.6.1]|uniref:hypothetical protein n=1 Tax=Petrotoga sp. 8T1HF07.NaAc.6.1 TaxID=1351838 RepID=UPI00192C752F|nr:hypothetical protein [Petrotoga sp. 8T1HF07.NaAc.6.1]MBL5980801.1 hypothetical protein [Petrotoga sp. 8T1HF07.NaAc.6.1]
MIDENTIKLMAKIMQEGMTGYKIAELLNDANKKFNFYKGEFSPPGKTRERKESYAQKWLNALREKGWEEVLSYIANQLLDKTRVYFEEDEQHPYPEELLNRLREKIQGTKIKEDKKTKRQITHGKTIRRMLKGIKNEKLAELLYQDLKDVDLCISVGAWKPALVLCGSILEAILSDWLESMPPEEIQKAFQELYPNKKIKKVFDYTLEQLIDIAEKNRAFTRISCHNQ